MAVSLSILAVLLTSAGQLLLKIGAGRSMPGRWLNGYVLAGYGLFAVTVLVSYYLMHIIDLKYFTAIMSASYVLVALASRIVLGEKIGRRRALGTLLIALGVAVFVVN